ncbi:glycerate kinase [uncultured Clostridium sp.]|uniref:glycerate kinase n=1 Tax=uncultured Clostridium sp. TaxID=59620 RepID=UPI0037DD4F43
MEGVFHTLVDATGGKVYTVETTTPLGNKVISKFGILPSTVNLDEALMSGKENVELTIENITKIIKIGVS